MALHGEYEPSALGMARDQVEVYERTEGREGSDNEGRPVVILTSIGARSGKIRKTPLMRVEHDGEYAVVASMGGASRNPLWYRNLTADPRAELQDRGTKKEYRAREVHGDEYDTWLVRAVATWPDYAEYQTRTDRTMPIVVLTPVES